MVILTLSVVLGNGEITNLAVSAMSGNGENSPEMREGGLDQ